MIAFAMEEALTEITQVVAFREAWISLGDEGVLLERVGPDSLVISPVVCSC